MKNPSSFVTEIDPALAPKLQRDLENQGFEISHPQHTFFMANKDKVSCTLYKSGKLVVQGKNKDDFITFYLEPEILTSFNYNYPTATTGDFVPHIGVDEAGKGDFFGPLCIAGVYATENDRLLMKQMGVKDSKKMSDAVLCKLAIKIRQQFAHHIVKINPAKYNELYLQFRNLNRLLAWGHATVIESLVAKTQCRKVVIDQFANESVVIDALKRKKVSLDLTQRHYAEEDLTVAAASILAREAFLNGLDSLGKPYGIKLPKGASQLVIDAGVAFAKQNGKEALSQVGKIHFKTLDAILKKIPE